ncbi:hypothetical protein BUALT_Bualt10G0012700 [Buddleja alternifolia]|uniref:Retroviral polymerase SH3-like domain-containing protein n=1 Tax=Buddleja alternifolia TaxID=168488 RepID=A0AAV6WWY8_9LAMI|nr:hypothetical protein BUALT_Bualt10G0012700 [Buddleja alternifolia]
MAKLATFLFYSWQGQLVKRIFRPLNPAGSQQNQDQISLLSSACYAWNGFKTIVSHLWVFGSLAYAHVVEEKRTKLDEKSERYVFVGYDQSYKGYKLDNPSNGKIVISRDVEFDEESSWDCNVS